MLKGCCPCAKGKEGALRLQQIPNNSIWKVLRRPCTITAYGLSIRTDKRIDNPYELFV